MLKIIGLAFIFTFIGKILAFFRVQQLAQNYGQEYWLDAFFIVFSFVSLFDSVLISGAIATTFIPKYLREKSKSISKAQCLYSDVFSVMASVFLMISTSLYFFSYEIALLLIKGNNIELINSVDYLLKYFSIFPLLSLFFQVPTIYNQANGNYKLSTLNPIFLNGIQLLLISIVAFYGIDAERDVLLFLIFYLLTMVICFSLQVKCYKPAMPKRIFSLKFKKLKYFSLSIIPFIIFISIEEMNLLVDQHFATSLNDGSVANLLYANRLVKIFGAIFVASIITVFYPKISALIVKNKYKKVRYISSLVIEFLAIFTIPIVAVFYFFSTKIVNLVYGNNMNINVADALSFYSFLVFTSSIYLIQIRLVYSIGISKFIILSCVSISVLNFFLNSIFIESFGLSGLAISTVIVSAIQVLLFDYYLRQKDMILISYKMIYRLLAHVFGILSIMMFIEHFLVTLMEEYWMFGVFFVLIIYSTLSVIFNRKLLIRLIKL